MAGVRGEEKAERNMAAGDMDSAVVDGERADDGPGEMGSEGGRCGECSSRGRAEMPSAVAEGIVRGALEPGEAAMIGEESGRG